MKGRPSGVQRKYAKARADEIKNHENYRQNENYPTTLFLFVAWWDKRFGTGPPPVPSVVEAEIQSRNPQFYDGPIVVPTSTTSGSTGVEGDKLAARIGPRVNHGEEAEPERSLGERIGGTLGDRITERETETRSLGERIGGSFAERVATPFGGKLANRILPRSLADRIDGGIRKRKEENTGGSAGPRRSAN